MTFKFFEQGKSPSTHDLLVIDVPSVLYCYTHAIKHNQEKLSYNVANEQRVTHALYGFFRMLSRFGSNTSYVFCFDAYPASSLPQAVREDIETAFQILSESGYPVLRIPRERATTLIHSTITRCYGWYQHIYFVTTRKELACRITPNTSLIHPLVKEEDIGVHNYEKELNTPYNTILLYLSIVGEPRGYYKGIKGIGKVRFLQMLKQLEEQGQDIRALEGQEFQVIRSFNLTDTQKEEAYQSLGRIYPRILPNITIPHMQVQERVMQRHLIHLGFHSLLSAWGWDLDKTSII